MASTTTPTTGHREGPGAQYIKIDPVASVDAMAKAGYFNPEAEAGVLGSIIIDPEAIEKVISTLMMEDFYRDAHRIIYEAIVALSQEGEGKADYITICDYLDLRGRLEDVGGASYIMSLINQVPTSGNVEDYARIVIRCALARDLAFLGSNIHAILAEHIEDPEEALSLVEQHFYQMTTKRVPTNLATMAEVMGLNIQTLERAATAPLGLATGWTALDRMMGLMFPGELIVIAARPGQGKTALSLSLTRQLARKGKKIAFFTLEMPKDQLGLRLLSMESGISHTKLRLGEIDNNPVVIDGETYSSEWESVILASDRLAELPIWVEDTDGLSTLQFRSLARRLVWQEGIDAIVVDYLQLLKVQGVHYDNRAQEIGHITKVLRATARELGVPIIALAQLNRAVEGRANKRPQLSDLREGGDIENDADKVLFLYRPEEEQPDQEEEGVAKYVRVHVYFAKNRAGEMDGEVPLFFIPDRTLFVPGSW